MALSDTAFNLESLNAELLDEDMEKEIKIVVLGGVESGKSSLIKIFFEDKAPQSVLKQNQPTYGAEINLYARDNNKIGVFDLAGQELDLWLSHSRAQDLFYEADGVFFMWTLSNNLKKKEMEEKILQLHQVVEKYAPKAKCVIILNKYDEFIHQKGTIKKANKIKKIIEDLSGYPTFIASLIPNYYPLLKIKLERIISEMPVEPPSIEINNTQLSYDQIQSQRLSEGAGRLASFKQDLYDSDQILSPNFGF